MATDELVQRGVAYANHAIQCDRDACQINDPIYYTRAVTNYELAISLFNQAHRIETDGDLQRQFSSRIRRYEERLAVMKDWLDRYHQQEERGRALSWRSSMSRLIVSPVISGWEPRSAQEPESERRAEPASELPIESHLQPNAPFQDVLSESDSATTSEEQPPAEDPELLVRVGEPSPPGEFIGGGTGKALAPRPSTGSTWTQLPLFELPSAVPQIRWSDIAGLSKAKELLMEATVLPDELPELFGDGQYRWKTILLYGPPGVGKSMLVSAAVVEGDSKLAKISIDLLLGSALKSPEESVEELFSAVSAAGKVVLHLPDAELVFPRNRPGTESESLLRGRARLLYELGILRSARDNVVFIATSRAPWELDETFLARMQHRIYVGLPNCHGRGQILEMLMRNVTHNVTLQEIEDIARECKGYTASDLSLVVREAAVETARTVRNAEFFRRVTVPSDGLREYRFAPCDKGDEGSVEMRYGSVRGKLLAPPITCLDFEVALLDTVPSVSPETLKKHEEFTKRAGKRGA